MKQIKYAEQKTFHYDNAEERLDHIEKMEQDGWLSGSRVKEFTGDLWSKDDLENESKYYYIGEFYKEERF